MAFSVLNVRDGATINTVRLANSSLTCLCFSPDGKMVVGGCFDGSTRVWDSRSGKLLGELIGHQSFVTSARIIDDGRKVITSSQDATIRLWDLSTFQQLNRFVQPGPVSSAIANSTATRILSTWDKELRGGGIDTAARKNVSLLNIQNGEEIHRYCYLRSNNYDLAVFSKTGDQVCLTFSKTSIWNASDGSFVRMTDGVRGFTS